MERRIKSWSLMTSMLVIFASACFADTSNPPHTDKDRWRVDCDVDKCIVLLYETEAGDNTVYAVLDKHTNKLRDFGFVFANQLDQAKGFIVQFVTTRVHSERPECAATGDVARPVDCYYMDAPEDQAFNGNFDECGRSCSARVMGQYVGDPKAGPSIDLLDHFMHDSFVFLMYADKSDKTQTVKLALRGFSEAYAEALAK